MTATQESQRNYKHTKEKKLNSESLVPDLKYEVSYLEKGFLCVGLDEVGRGCLAGPVVTAAVVLPDYILNSKTPTITEREKIWKQQIDSSNWWWFLDDSKRVLPKDREDLAFRIWKNCHVQVGWCLPEEIDTWNILHASMLAMRQAAAPFTGLAQVLLVDGHMDPFHSRFSKKENKLSAKDLGFINVETLVKGDQKSLSIAAASIVAKVYRDQWMSHLESVFPGYGFAQHKGYSTDQHHDALRMLGPCSIHRKSFAPISGAGDPLQPELF